MIGKFFRKKRGVPPAAVPSPAKVVPAARAQMDPAARREMRISRYLEEGRVPWSVGYDDFKWDFISQVISDETLCRRINAGDVPGGYGTGLDERVVEYPWVVPYLLDADGPVLDAGSVLNFESFVRLGGFDPTRLTIAGLAVEKQCHYDSGVSYQFCDLRRLPFRDQWFELTVSVSTLEHIGMENEIYGHGNAEEAHASPVAGGHLEAVDELIRVTRRGGGIAISVPVGIYENHGFFQQFDRSMMDGMIRALERFGTVSETFFRYSEGGWTAAAWEECRDSVSFNPHTGKGKGDDGAAHCRAVGCLFAKGR